MDLIAADIVYRLSQSSVSFLEHTEVKLSLMTLKMGTSAYPCLRVILLESFPTIGKIITGL